MAALTPDTNLFDIALESFKKYIDTEPHNQVASVLWGLHTHIYQKFEYSPRLSYQSPTPESGKSEALKWLQFVTPNAKVLSSPTGPTLFRMMGNKTLLIDEADNNPIRGQILEILNRGHQKGGTVPRVYKNDIIDWPVFGPVALAGIGSLPAILTSRCIVIQMFRKNPDVKLERLDMNNLEQMRELAFINEMAAEWAENVKLNINPVMPDGFDGRKGNKWRVLFAIADALGRGELAREAASLFPGNNIHESELLLHDISKIFLKKKSVYVIGEDMAIGLNTLEDSEYDWSTYKGRGMTATILGRILSTFGIKPQLMWLPEGKPRIFQHRRRTYIKSDFEEMWQRYKVPLPPAATSATSATTEPVVQLVPKKPPKKRRITKA